MSDLDLARDALAAIPGLKGAGLPQRLGGLTNLVFRAGDYCLRIPGKGTEEFIDRANEAVAAREAAKAGVSPEVIHVDPATGVMVTRFVHGAVTMSPQNFRTREGAPRRARSEEHTSELQSRENLVCRLLLEKKKKATT